MTVFAKVPMSGKKIISRRFKFRCVDIYIHKMENSVDVPRNMLFKKSLCINTLLYFVQY